MVDGYPTHISVHSNLGAVSAAWFTIIHDRLADLTTRLRNTADEDGAFCLPPSGTTHRLVTLDRRVDPKGPGAVVYGVHDSSVYDGARQMLGYRRFTLDLSDPGAPLVEEEISPLPIAPWPGQDS